MDTKKKNMPQAAQPLECKEGALLVEIFRGIFSPLQSKRKHA